MSVPLENALWPRGGGVFPTLAPDGIDFIMIEELSLVLPDLSLDMDLSPSLILFIPVAARLSLSVLRYSSLDILFIDQRETFLYCMAIGILSYGAVMNSSLVSGILVGLGSRAIITYILQGRRWTVLCGLLLGMFSSDVVTLFWTYVNQENQRWNLEYEKDQARRKRRSLKRRISDPRPPNPALAAQTAAIDADLVQNGDPDKDALILKRRIAQAEAEVNRLQEERKWSMYAAPSSYRATTNKVPDLKAIQHAPCSSNGRLIGMKR